MVCDERFGGANRMVPFMGLDVVTDFFGGAAVPVLVSAFEKAARIVARIAAAVEGWDRRLATRREPMALDDRWLCEIGIARGEIPAMVNQMKPAHRL